MRPYLQHADILAPAEEVKRMMHVPKDYKELERLQSSDIEVRVEEGSPH